MSSPFTVEVFGTEVLAARFQSELREFKREQRKMIRKAANVVKKDVEAKVASTFPANTKAHKRRGATPLGPLRRKIRVRVLDTTGDVAALIRPSASAFYGRFQETGLNVTRKGRIVSTTSNIIGRKKSTRSGSSPFNLPAKPFLAPVAAADAGKVAEIMGDSYGVFFTGGA
jgi:HK97 gp10 family phage protein